MTMTRENLVAYVARVGEHLTGGDPAEVTVYTWTRRLTTTLAHQFMEAGTFQPWAAVAMWSAGYGPDVAAKRIQVQGTSMTVGYAVSNGDLDVADIDVYA